MWSPLLHLSQNVLSLKNSWRLTKSKIIFQQDFRFSQVTIAKCCSSRSCLQMITIAISLQWMPIGEGGGVNGVKVGFQPLKIISPAASWLRWCIQVYRCMRVYVCWYKDKCGWTLSHPAKDRFRHLAITDEALAPKAETVHGTVHTTVPITMRSQRPDKWPFVTMKSRPFARNMGYFNVWFLVTDLSTHVSLYIYNIYIYSIY